jgi:MoxR-like ATPase
MEGTYPLPEAQLDRFIFKVNIPYPSPDDLNEILNRTTGANVPVVERVSDGGTILAMQHLARQVPIPSHVSEFASRVIVASHPGENAPAMVNQYVRYGASPRGGQAMILGAKITGLLSGRYNASFEDVIAVAPASLRHRLLLNFEGQAEGINTDEIIGEILTAVPEE